MKTVMIVDDDKFIHKLLSKILSKEEYVISCSAYDGSEAVEKYTSVDSKPDIIIMDHRMPVMNGITATTEILQNYPEAKIIFLSADTTVEEDAIQSGAKFFLVKPVLIRTLCEHIEKCFNQQERT